MKPWTKGHRVFKYDCFSKKRVCHDSAEKRLRNIADNADRKAHNLYLNHAQAKPSAEYVDYEDEETDCSSDISEVILNLDTYKLSISNRLISLTDPKYEQLTPFVAKSSQMRLGLPSTAVVGDRFGVSDRDVAAIASSVLHDVGLTTSNNSDLVVDENKLRREKAKIRLQVLSETQALPLKGLYFDGRKDSTLIEERVNTKRYTRKAKEERLCLIEELGSRYITHLAPQKRFPLLLSGILKGSQEIFLSFWQLAVTAHLLISDENPVFGIEAW
ncbi:hypothetical protein AVEN_196902-1 [Araneus ventricosus]|uniref:Uncharacterized protein n=1 Tax=Araneus ventricosus TaxID=182803 RepID=A0A4Y2ECY8_ARAVE|nr:hypothetical protein AVEN_196902-1 [Araneus ventricosus]